jgi:hypothetical protein
VKGGLLGWDCGAVFLSFATLLLPVVIMVVEAVELVSIVVDKGMLLDVVRC